MKKLSNTILLSLQIEFEETEITLEELCSKYKVTTAQLTNHKKWVKKSSILDLSSHILELEGHKEDLEKFKETTQPTIVQDVVANKSTPIAIENKPTPIAVAKKSTPVVIEDSEEDRNSPESLLRDVGKFKRLAMDYALEFMANDAQYHDIKDFRDIVNVVDKIESSLVTKEDKAPTTTVNIAIQNLVEKFSEDDI